MPRLTLFDLRWRLAGPHSRLAPAPWLPAPRCTAAGAAELRPASGPCTPFQMIVIADFSVRRGRSTKRCNSSSFVGPGRTGLGLQGRPACALRAFRPAFLPHCCYANQVTSPRSSPQLPIKLQTGSGRAGGRAGDVRCSASRSAACLGLAIFKIFSSRIVPPSFFPLFLLPPPSREIYF